MKTIFYCVLFFLLFACKPESDPRKREDLGTIGLGRFSDYFYFRPNSYWIYENNRTKELDTCTLVSIYRDTVNLEYETVNFVRRLKQEIINFTIYSRHRNGMVNYWTTNPCLGCNEYDSLYTISKYINGIDVFYFPWNRYPNQSHYFPTLVIDGQTYTDVYKFDCEMDSSIPFWDDSILLWGGQNGSANYSSYYWARHVGLVKLDFKKFISDKTLDSASWVLKDSDIRAF